MPYQETFVLAAQALLLCFSLFFLSLILNRLVLPKITKHIEKKQNTILPNLLKGFKRPLSVFLKFGSICFAFILFFANVKQPAPAWLLTFGAWALPHLHKAVRIAIIIAITWGLVNTSKVYVLLLEKARDKLDLPMRKSATRFISAIFNVITISLAVVIIITELGYNVTGLVAGLGLGGLTIALAAKDSAANFFGGIVLIAERPFEIGDWITCDEVEGTVEDISLRSTKIRTGPGSLTIVPNANISNAAITNWSGGMEKRRANFKLQLPIDTQENNIRKYMESIRTMLETDPEIMSDSILVRFSDIVNAGINIQIMFYTNVPAYTDYMRVMERVNFSLITLAKNNHIQFAYPTQTLNLKKENKK